MEVITIFEKSGSIEVYLYGGGYVGTFNTNAIGTLRWECGVSGYYTFIHSKGVIYSYAKKMVDVSCTIPGVRFTGLRSWPTAIAHTAPSPAAVTFKMCARIL